MSKQKKLILVCCCMIGAGFFLCGMGYAMGGRVWGVGLGSDGIWVNTPNISGENTSSYVEESKELEDFTDIEIDMKYGDLLIEPSDHFGIMYCVNSSYNFSVEVVDGCLKVTENNSRDIFSGDFIICGFGNRYGSPLKNEYVKIYIPEDADFDVVKLTNDSGDVKGNGICSQELEIYADYGDVSLKEIQSSEAVIKVNSGNLELTDFSDGNLTVENDYGKTKFKNVKGKVITGTMNSGDFAAAGMSGEQLLLKQDYGEVKLEDTKIAGEAEVSDDSGNIELSGVEVGYLKLKSDYGHIRGENVSFGEGDFVLESGDCMIHKLSMDVLQMVSDYGDVELALTKPVGEYELKVGTEYGRVEIDGEDMGEVYKSLEKHEKRLEIQCESGNVTVSGMEK